MTATTFEDNADTIVVTKESDAVVKTGPIGAFFSTLNRYKYWILGAAAAGGAGYLAYDAVKNGKVEEAAGHVEEAVKVAAELAA